MLSSLLGNLAEGEDNNKVDFQEIGWGCGLDWTDPAQDRGRWQAIVNTVMTFRVRKNKEILLTGWGTVNLRRLCYTQLVSEFLSLRIGPVNAHEKQRKRLRESMEIVL